MKKLFALIALTLTACGGGSADPPPHRIVFMGDSITYFWTDLQTLAPAAINAGVGGNTSQMMDARFQQDVLAYHPATVVILAGTNDIYDEPNPTPAAVFDMAQRAKAAGAHVIVGTVPPIGNWVSSDVVTSVAMGQAEITQYNRELRDGAAADGYAVADYYTAMLNPDGTQNASLFNADLIHPDAAGYTVMDGVLKPLLDTAPH